MQRTVGIVKVTMLKAAPILFEVQGIERKSLQIYENTGLIHVIPNRVHVIRPREIFVGKTLAPEFLSIFIKYVYPHWLSRPAICLENIILSILDKNVC